MKIILIVILLFVIVIGGFSLFTSGDEDVWTCERGEWVKQGNPDGPQPQEPCNGRSNRSPSDYVQTLTDGIKKVEELNRSSYTLDLHNQGLESFPSEILDQTHIRVLNLSDNQLTSLPAEIGTLTNLEELYLENNLLTGALVAEIRHMKNLTILDASANALTGIPAEIGQLKRLESIDFSNNQLNTMPDEIANIADSLKTFNLSGNRYSDEQIDQIKGQLPLTLIIN